MKKFSKILTLVLTVLLVLSNARAVYADPTGPTPPPTPGEDTIYAPVAGPSEVKFKKFLITELGQELTQDYTFTYKVTPGEAVAGKAGKPEYWTFNGVDYYVNAEAVEAAKAAVVDDTAGTTDKWIYNGEQFDTKDAAEDKAILDIKHTQAVSGNDGKFEIFAGPDADKVIVGVATFKTTDAGTDDKITIVEAGDNLELKEGEEVYSRRTVNIDFSRVNFNEPGVYRYVLTEQVIEGVEGIDYDIQAQPTDPMTRIIDVYVVDNDLTGPGDPELSVKEVVLHEIKTTIKTNDEMGSQDAQINDEIATKWAIINVPAPYDTAQSTPKPYPGIDTAGYDTYDLANAVRKKIRERIHDDILAQNELINGDNVPGPGLDPIVKELNEATDAYNNAATAVGLTEKQAEYNAAKLAREQKEAQIETLKTQLSNTTDPAEITRLRGEIDTARTELGDDTSGLVKAEKDAKTALDQANASIKSAEDRLEAAQEAYDEVDNKIKYLQELYNKLGSEGETDPNDYIVPIAWELADKSDNFVNEIDPLFKLQFHKKVTGNQGSRDKYFRFDLKLELLKPNELVTLDGKPNSNWTEAPTKNEATNYASSVMKAANTIKDADPDILYEDALADEDYNEKLFTFVKGNVTYYYDESQIINDQAINHGVAENVWYADNTVDDTLDAYVVAPENDAQHTGLQGLQLRANASGVLEHTFYLKHDEWIRFINLRKDIEYTITEEAEDYKSAEKTTKPVLDTADGLAVEKAALQTAITDQEEIINDPLSTPEQVAKATAAKDVLDKQLKKLQDKVHDDATTGTLNYHKFTGYTNTRNGIIPTGVMAAAGTGALILGAGIIGLVALSRRREEDEDE